MPNPPRHDFRDRTKLKPGKKRVSYPQKSAAHPTIEENFVDQKKAGGYTPNFGVSHPDATAFPNAKKVEFERESGDDTGANTAETFKTLPGPLLGGAAKTVPKRTPPKYITSEAITTTTQDVDYGTAAAAVTGEGDSSVVTPKDAVESEKQTSVSTLTTAGTTEYRKDGDDQLMTVAGSVGTDGSAPTITALTELAEVNALGGGQYERVAGTVAAVFDAFTQTAQQTPVVPRKFLNITSETSSASTAAGTDTTPAAVGSGGLGVMESRAQRTSALKVRVESTTRAGTTSSSLTEYQRNAEDQVVTITSSVGTDGSAPSLSATTEIARVDAIGDGKFERAIGVVSEVFDAKGVSDSGGIAFPKLHHRNFLASPKTETTETTAAGTSTAPDTLAANGLGITESRLVRQGELKVRKTNTVESGTPTALTGYEFDEATGLLLPLTVEAVAAATAGTALQSDGTYKTVEPYNTVWSIATTRKATALTTRTYHVSEHVSLPRVLIQFSPVVFNDTSGNIIYAGFYHELKDYSGVYDITITEVWQATAHTGLSATNLVATAIQWITPFGGGSIPECLHDNITISGNTASDGSTPAGNNRFYDYYAWSFFFPATSPSSLSGTITIKDVQQPWRGGYLRRTETITI